MINAKCKAVASVQVYARKPDISGLRAKAFIKYPKDCWGCASCIKECHFGAIALYLGADIGGMGSLMTVKSTPDTLTWDIKKRDGSKEEILINKKESNKY